MVELVILSQDPNQVQTELCRHQPNLLALFLLQISPEASLYAQVLIVRISVLLHNHYYHHHYWLQYTSYFRCSRVYLERQKIA